jgi:hypothetical protein
MIKLRDSWLLIAGLALGLLVLVPLWFLAVFAVIDPSPQPNSRQAAVRIAVSEGGIRWPGTTVSVSNSGEDRISIERWWLGLLETSSTVQRARGKWILGSSPQHGPAEIVQVVVFALLPSTTVLLVFLSLLLRRRKRESYRDK